MSQDIVKPRQFVLDEELSKAIGLKCIDCNSPRTVYAITVPRPPHIMPGAYCYNCLLKRCIKAHAVPFPIPLEILDRLEHDIKQFFTGLKKYH